MPTLNQTIADIETQIAYGFGITPADPLFKELVRTTDESDNHPLGRRCSLLVALWDTRVHEETAGLFA